MGEEGWTFNDSHHSRVFFVFALTLLVFFSFLPSGDMPVTHIRQHELCALHEWKMVRRFSVRMTKTNARGGGGGTNVTVCHSFISNECIFGRELQCRDFTHAF